MTYLEEEKTCSASTSCGSTQKVCPKTCQPITEKAVEKTCSEKACS